MIKMGQTKIKCKSNTNKNYSLHCSFSFQTTFNYHSMAWIVAVAFVARLLRKSINCTIIQFMSNNKCDAWCFWGTFQTDEYLKILTSIAYIYIYIFKANSVEMMLYSVCMLNVGKWNCSQHSFAENFPCIRIHTLHTYTFFWPLIPNSNSMRSQQK